MHKFIIFFLIPLFIFTLNCKGKKEKKVEINQKSGVFYKEAEQHPAEPVNKTPKTALTPEMFFKMTIEIYKITKKYSPTHIENQPVVESNIKSMEEEINAVYKKYTITKNEFEEYGEKEFQAIEDYKEAYPELNGKLE